MNDGRGRETILSDLFEALIGAIYLDGGIQVAEDFFLNTFEENITAILQNPLKNSKALLQDYCQKKFQCTPHYYVLDEHGPDHSKLFRIVAKVHDKELGYGEGASKKEAQQAAAHDSLTRLQEIDYGS